MFFNMDFNILQAENPADFELRYLYDEEEPTFRLNLKGVPFIGAIVRPNHINTFQWETMCVAYDSTINNVTLVFRGVTVFKVVKECILSVVFRLSLTGTIKPVGYWGIIQYLHQVHRNR